MQELAIAGILIIPVVIGVTEKVKTWFKLNAGQAEIFASAFAFLSAVLALVIGEGLLHADAVMALRIVYGALAFVVTPQGIYDYIKATFQTQKTIIRD